MKILILSCNTGEGHNSAGKAVMEAALLRGHEVEFMDLMLLGGKTVSHMVGGAYISIVRHIPAFFSLLYKVGGLISSSTRKSPVYYANSLLAGRLDRYIKEHSFDLILTPHLYAAEVLTCLKHRGLLSVPVIAIGTDYTCIPFWEETDCDCYIVPQKDLLGELIHKVTYTFPVINVCYPSEGSAGRTYPQRASKKAAFSTWYSGKAGFFHPEETLSCPKVLPTAFGCSCLSGHERQHGIWEGQPSCR